MAKELVNKPGWLETLWNVNPRLAREAENDIIDWLEDGINEDMRVETINDPEFLIKKY